MKTEESWTKLLLSVLLGVPLGAPAIGMVQAFGLGILVALLTYQVPHDDPKDEERTALVKLARATTLGAVPPLACVALGWVARLFS